MTASQDGARLANGLIADYDSAHAENTLLGAAQRLPDHDRGLTLFNAASYAIEVARFLLRSMEQHGLDAENELARANDYIVSTHMEHIQRAHEIIEELRAQHERAHGTPTHSDRNE